MGERKVLNKYFPPDFDPAKLPRGKRQDHNSMKVRMMLPMSVRCNTCGNFMYKGTKFNCKKQDVEGESYLGIQILRFYFRCASCAAEFILKTDPKNTDYTMEKGATRNYEPWRDTDKTVAEAKAQREEEERGNAMKALENRTLDSKREMDIMTALDELISVNARHQRVDTDAALAALKRSAAEDGEEVDLTEEDEATVRRMFLQQRAAAVKRLHDSPPPSQDTEVTVPEPSAAVADKSLQRAEAPSSFGMRARPVTIIHKKRKAEPDIAAEGAPAQKKAAGEGVNEADDAGTTSNSTENGGGGLLGLGSYGSESE